MSEKQSRGALTERVQNKAVELFGREITTKELRLMPYILTCAQDKRYIDQSKINDAERELLNQWFNDEWLSGASYEFCISHDYYIKFAELIWLAYVDLSQ